MPSNMSFFMTTEQILDKSKTVTRRLGWYHLADGEELWACRKCMGLKKGEKIERLALIRVVSTRLEPLNAITWEDCRLEGFPDMGPAEFVDMLSSHYKCAPDRQVNRIEFEYI